MEKRAPSPANGRTTMPASYAPGANPVWEFRVPHPPRQPQRLGVPHVLKERDEQQDPGVVGQENPTGLANPKERQQDGDQ